VTDGNAGVARLRAGESEHPIPMNPVCAVLLWMERGCWLNLGGLSEYSDLAFDSQLILVAYLSNWMIIGGVYGWPARAGGLGTSTFCPVLAVRKTFIVITLADRIT
jgi:hypothetical protein